MEIENLYKIKGELLFFSLVLSAIFVSLSYLPGSDSLNTCEYDFDVKSVEVDKDKLNLVMDFQSQPATDFSFSTTVITESTGVVLTDREKYNSRNNETYKLGFNFKSFAVDENITHITNTLSPDGCKENIKVEVYQPFANMEYKACKDHCKGSEDIFSNF